MDCVDGVEGGVVVVMPICMDRGLGEIELDIGDGIRYLRAGGDQAIACKHLVYDAIRVI
jgi:hypothetical protein